MISFILSLLVEFAKNTLHVIMCLFGDWRSNLYMIWFLAMIGGIMLLPLVALYAAACIVKTGFNCFW